MRRARIGAWAAAVLAVAAAAARGQFGGPTAVYLEPVERRTVRQTVELPGTAEAVRASTVSAEAGGRIEQMLAQEGDFVGAGKPLCEMRRLPTELELKQAEGLLAAALADLKKMEQGYRPEEIAQAEARHKSARAADERWRLEYERTKRLLADGASTKAELEAVEAAHRQAVEALAEAEAYLKLVQAGYRAEDVDRARAQAAAQQAAADQLKDTLAKMTVAMPFDGFVVRKVTEVGEWLRPGDPVVDVVDLSVVRLLLDVPERYIAGLQQGSATPVVFESLPDREFAGKVSQIVPASASGTHTIPVRVDIANPMEEGRPAIAAGLFGRAWLPVGKEHAALLVPKAAVIRQGGQDLVYTVSDTPPPEAAEVLARMAEAAKKMGGGAEPPKEEKPLGPPPPPMKFAVAVPIRILQGYGRLMEVESDRLKEGVPVVTRGTYLLYTGAPVQVREKEGAGAPAEAAPKAGAAPADKPPVAPGEAAPKAGAALADKPPVAPGGAAGAGE